jgi:hypothetical protein
MGFTNSGASMKVQIEKSIIEEALLSFKGYRRELGEINDGQPCDAEKKLRAAYEASQAVEPEQKPSLPTSHVYAATSKTTQVLFWTEQDRDNFANAYPASLHLSRTTIPVFGTHPSPAKPLSDEQIDQLWIDTPEDQDGNDFVLFARAIEAAHGIKETS